MQALIVIEQTNIYPAVIFTNSSPTLEALRNAQSADKRVQDIQMKLQKLKKAFKMVSLLAGITVSVACPQ